MCPDSPLAPAPRPSAIEAGLPLLCTGVPGRQLDAWLRISKYVGTDWSASGLNIALQQTDFVTRIVLIPERIGYT